MRIVTWLAAVVVLFSPSPSRALEVLSATMTMENEGRVYLLVADVVIDAPPLAVRHAVNHLCENHREMPYNFYCRVYKVEGRRTWSYGIVAPPVLDPRDYSLENAIVEDLRPDGSGLYRTTWALSPRGPAPRAGFVRLASDDGFITIKAAGAGARSLMHYEIRTTPGGNIPAWVGGYVAKVTLPDGMRVIERLALAAQKRGVVDRPVTGDPLAGVAARPLDNPLPTPVRRASVP